MTAKGHFCLGAYLIESENYECLLDNLQQPFETISNLNSINVNGNTFAVEKFMGGDLKFLLLFSGLNAANSDFSCIYCHCGSGAYYEKTDRSKQWYMSQEWSMIDSLKGARSFSISERLRREVRSTGKKEDIAKRLGYAREPISSTIPFQNYVIDLLHMFLRISDVLFENLISFLTKLETIELISQGGPIFQDRYLNIFYYYLKRKCHN